MNQLVTKKPQIQHLFNYQKINITRKHSSTGSRMRTVRLPDVSTGWGGVLKRTSLNRFPDVSTGGWRGGPKMNTFEQVSSVCHQISLARPKGPCTVGSHVRVIVTRNTPLPQPVDRLKTLHSRNFVGRW